MRVWLRRLWARIVYILRHPWQSLVSFFAAITGFIFWILKLLWRALVWIARCLRGLFRVSFGRFLGRLAWAFVGLCILLFIGAAILVNIRQTKVPNYEPVDERVYLSEGMGWTGGQNEPLRQLFYYTPQGAGLKDMRYSWFVNLEVPWGSTRFADMKRMSRYGFLVDTAPTQLNPDRLPVGFTWHYDAKFGERMLDLSCAACHTGELNVTSKTGKKYGLRVDGAGAMHAFTAMNIGDFAPELMGSMLSTYLNPFKFLRFAKAVLGHDYPQGRWKLHGEMRSVIGQLMSQAWNENLSRHLYPTEEGPGRIDALGRIGNTVFGQELSPNNYLLSNAPVRYPPLWDIWKFDYVQYNASVRQPMTRNASESMGVGARAELLNMYGAPIPRDQRFDFTVMMDNLAELETALWSLEPPKWNESCMGSIHWDSAKRGQKLFAATCQACHGPFPADENIKEWFAYMKTAGYKDFVIGNWQQFLNQAYGVQTQPIPQALPAGETPIGIQLDSQERLDLAGSKGPVGLFSPLPTTTSVGEQEEQPSTSGFALTPLLPAGGHEEQQEEQAGHQALGSAPPTNYGPAPQIAKDYDFPLWMMKPKATDDIGTDPTAAVNFVDKQIDLTKLGLDPNVAIAGMRTLLEEDLSGETDAYAKEVLRLSGNGSKLPVSPCQNAAGRNTTCPVAIRQMTEKMRNDLRKAAQDIANSCHSKTPPASYHCSDTELQEDIAQFEDAVNSGPARIKNELASLDLSKLNTGIALRLIVFRARRRFYAQRRYTEPERDELNGFGELDVPMPLPQYKPRPLAGIWAAGPFLHNGSVPTIYQLLLPADQRDKKFFVGTREFDAVNLGLSTQPTGRGGFWLDTTITGNSNAGHEFRKGSLEKGEGYLPRYGVIGPEWSEQDRRDIIEYLKIHRDEHKKDFLTDPDGYLREGLDNRDICQ